MRLFQVFLFYVFCLNAVLANGLGRAVVPSVVINAGEVLSELKLKELDVTNSNLRGNYARYIKDVKGLVTRRTLLPDRIILLSALHRPYVISRGDKVRIILNQGNMTISAAGVALSDASVGDAISVKNIDTGVIVSGSALDAGTVRIIIK